MLSMPYPKSKSLAFKTTVTVTVSEECRSIFLRGRVDQDFLKPEWSIDLFRGKSQTCPIQGLSMIDNVFELDPNLG